MRQLLRRKWYECSKLERSNRSTEKGVFLGAIEFRFICYANRSFTNQFIFTSYKTSPSQFFISKNLINVILNLPSTVKNNVDVQH